MDSNKNLFWVCPAKSVIVLCDESHRNKILWTLELMGLYFQQQQQLWLKKYTMRIKSMVSMTKMAKPTKKRSPTATKTENLTKIRHTIGNSDYKLITGRYTAKTQ